MSTSRGQVIHLSPCPSVHEAGLESICLVTSSRNDTAVGPPSVSCKTLVTRQGCRVAKTNQLANTGDGFESDFAYFLLVVNNLASDGHWHSLPL